MSDNTDKPKRKSKDIMRTVNGITGIQINKVLEFITGERAVKYGWDDENKEFIYKVKKEFGTDEPIKPMTKKQMLEAFEHFFQVKVKLVDF